MKVSYNWLHEYLNFSVSTDELSSILTSTGLEVEGVSTFFSAFDHLVVGKVIECTPHPNADKLKITKVNVGDEIKQIICGAKNVEKGQFVVVVLVGNTLLNNKGDELEIKKVKIRGEWSEGMICSEVETGLGDDQSGIMELVGDLCPGGLLSHHFNVQKDSTLEIGLTPNRTDAFGHIGVCRDLFAYFSHRNVPVTLSLPKVLNFRSHSDLSIKLDVQNSTACPKYFGVCIENVTIKDSPKWLQAKLISIGLKPINNLVDITNFVLHETGNPLHAFDFEKIINTNIIVRNATKDEVFETLDFKKINLVEDDLVICDKDKPLCLAGVIGGVNSGVISTTKNIFLECAFFDEQFIRKTSKRHQISSDASYRFERGVDFGNCEYTLKRAALLIQDICGGTLGQVVNFSSGTLKRRKIDFSFDYCDRVLGFQIEKNSIQRILTSLDFEILDLKEDSCTLIVPTYRCDVYRPIDVVEEILRIYGYDQLPHNRFIKYSPQLDTTFSFNDFKIQVANLLVADGFFETQNNSLIPESSLNIFKLNSDKNIVRLLNPLSKDLSILRPNMFFSGLQVIKHNLNRQVDRVKIFEYGKIYLSDKRGFLEKEKLTIYSCGMFQGESWHEDNRPVDFFFMKGVFDKILDLYQIDHSKLSMLEKEYDYSTETLVYSYNNQIITSIGCFTKKTLKLLGIKKDVYYIDSDLELLFSLCKSNTKHYRPVPKFPFVKRDLSLLVDKKVSYLNIKNTIEASNNPFLEDISIFDVYLGKDLEKNKKSYSISLLFQNPEKTLTDKVVDKQVLKIFELLESKFNVCLRDGELNKN